MIEDGGHPPSRLPPSIVVPSIPSISTNLSSLPPPPSRVSPSEMNNMNATTSATAAAPPPPPILSHSPPDHDHDDLHSDDEHPTKGGGKGGNTSGKSRRELPAGAVTILKAWLLSPEHFTHPYPTPQDQIMLMQKTGIDKKQLKNWFTNARRRIWKPMLKKQLEAGKMAAGVGGVSMGGVAGGVSGVSMPVQGGMVVQGMVPDPSQQQHQQQQGMVVPGMAMVGQGPMGVDMSHMGGGQPGGGQMQYQDPGQQQPQQHHPAQDSMYSNFQQAQMQQQMQQPQQQPGYEYNNQMYQQQPPPYYQQPPDNQSMPAPTSSHLHNQHAQIMHPTNSIGSLPPMNPAEPSTTSLTSSTNNQMIKTDSHAVLMELFARDQDLVRQASAKGHSSGDQGGGGGMGSGGEDGVNPSNVSSMGGASASLQASGPSGILRNYNTASTAAMGGATAAAAAAGGMGGGGMHKQNSVTFDRVPTLSSWPHFSSVSSLNNLGGTLAGVKSITNLSAADLSSQGNLNKMGNLAQVKSIENMGRGDSYAFLEVFFDDRSGIASGMNGSSGALSTGGGSTGQRGIKRERDDDDAIGLSLDGDDSTPMAVNSSSKQCSDHQQTTTESETPTPAPLPQESKNDDTDGGKLKRAYDDALAARGLIAVRMSCEKLTDLALPAKMQRTLSQEYIRQHQQGQSMGNFFSTSPSQFPSQQLDQASGSDSLAPAPLSDPATMASNSVEVPSTTICALCGSINVDTQLRPCGHMFHGRCLKPSLQNAVGPPKCPIDHTAMQSAVLAVPTAAPEGRAPSAPA